MVPVTLKHSSEVSEWIAFSILKCYRSYTVCHRRKNEKLFLCLSKVNVVAAFFEQFISNFVGAADKHILSLKVQFSLTLQYKTSDSRHVDTSCIRDSLLLTTRLKINPHFNPKSLKVKFPESDVTAGVKSSRRSGCTSSSLFQSWLALGLWAAAVPLHSAQSSPHNTLQSMNMSLDFRACHGIYVNSDKSN